MTFALTPAAPFTAGVSTISAATANTWRTNISQSLDTVNGGAYVNVSTIDWSAGGAGWRFYAALAIKSTGTLTLDAGATVTINADPSLFGTMRVGIGAAGGGVRFYATSTLTVDDTVACSIAGDVTMTGASTMVRASGSTDTHASGSTDTYSSGSTFLISSGTIANLNLGGTAASGVTFIGANGAAVWNGASTATWQTASVSNFNSGASLTISSGAIVAATIGGGGAAGSLTMGADGTLTVPTTCTTSLSLGADGTFVVTAGAAVTMSVGGGGTTGSLTINANGTLETTASSTITMGGTTTRTGAEIVSGTGAYTYLRVYNAPTGSYSINPKHYDRVIRTCGFNATETLTLTPDPGATDYIEIYVIHNDNNVSTLDVRDAGAALIFSSTPGSGKTGALQLIWNGSAWQVGVYSAV